MKSRRIWLVLGVIIVLVLIILVYFQESNQVTTGDRKRESTLPNAYTKQYAENGKIRVLLKSEGYRQIVHDSVKLKAKSGLRIICGEKVFESNPEEAILINPDDEKFRTGTIRISCINSVEKITVLSFKRGCGEASYRGILELYSTAEGIVVVNELLLEEYLYAVVPSEMPSTYELEALKSQAVCARSYAYNQSRTFFYPEYAAHVDDSTSFQVYGNSAEQVSTTRAVDETLGEKIWYKDRVATAYYYSTSCGKSASITAWGGMMTEDNAYLQSVAISDESDVDYEKNLAWYRWSVMIPSDTLHNQLELYTKENLGNLQSVSVTKQGDGGIVQEITVVGERKTVVIQTENKIRRALGGTGCVITRNDGSQSVCGELLPSAFFSIKNTGNGYLLEGGGYGHGIGMSQNGANEMAKRGKDYREILKTFYLGVEIK